MDVSEVDVPSLKERDVLQIVEYNGSDMTRTGKSQTKDGSRWTAVCAVDDVPGSVYNRVKADYLAVTNTGKVAAFKVIHRRESNILLQFPCIE